MMPPTPDADDIISCARGWIGTRFQHQGRLKKSESHAGGVDCLGLLIGVARELALVGHKGLPLVNLDIRDYSKTPDHAKLRDILGEHLYITESKNIQPADIGLFSIKNLPQHLAIFAQNLDGDSTMIHAYAQARKVVEHGFDEYWQQYLVAAFRLPCLHA